MYDSELIRKTLEDAAVNMAGEEYVLRRTLENIFPSIRFAIERGMSFDQLTEHLNSFGMEFEVASVKDCYIDVLQQKSIECATLTLKIFEEFKRNGVITVPVSKNGLRCLPLRKCVRPFDRHADVPEEVYQEGPLEHPAINGLFLSIDERLFGSNLELIDSTGQEIFETDIEKRSRAIWQKPMSNLQTVK